MLSVSCNSSRGGTQLRSSGGERWPSGEEELVLDRQMQYSSGLESNRQDGFDYIQQLRSSEGGTDPDPGGSGAIVENPLAL